MFQLGAPASLARARADLAARPAGRRRRAPFLASSRTRSCSPRDVAAAIPSRVPGRSEEPGATLVVPLRGTRTGRRARAGRRRDPAVGLLGRDLSLARGIGDIASLALGSARRLHELERFHELVESLDAIFWEADPETLAFTFLSRRASTLLGRSDEAAGRGPAPGAITSTSRTGPARRGGAAARIATHGQDLILEYRALGAGGRAAVAARPRPRRDRRARRRCAAGAHRRHHRAQAGRAGAAAKRAEVLRGLPPRARGDAAAARARRDEEHVPRGRLARPADAAHLDPRLGGHARAGGPRDPAGGRARPAPADRGERPQARAAALGPAGPRPAPARDRLALSDGPPTSRGARPADGPRVRHCSTGRDVRRRRRSEVVPTSTPRRSSGSSRTSLANAGRHTPPSSPLWVRGRARAAAS